MALLPLYGNARIVNRMLTENNTTHLSDIDHLLWCVSMNDDRSAFRSLFDLFYVPLCIYAKRFIPEKTNREDIIQDVFFSIWENRKRISINTSTKNYLITCVKNSCLNFLRKQENWQDFQNLLTENPPVYAENIDDIYNLKELQELLDKTLEKLPEEYRIAFILSRMEDKSSPEIAETMGVSVRTVERYRNRATELLKDELKDYLPLSVIIVLLS